MTCIIQIGNSDDKLSQARWALFIEATERVVRRSAQEVHFGGTSFPHKPWQNAAWVFEINPDKRVELWMELQHLSGIFSQDSIAFTEGLTQFVGSITPFPPGFPILTTYDPDKL